MTGIVSYGTYIPNYRVTIRDIAACWGKDPGEIEKALGVAEKSVPGIDEDAVTLAIEAAHTCLDTFQGVPQDIGALFVGSESHPYAVNPTSTIVGEILGVGRQYLAADMEFACKAGTAGLQVVAGLIQSGHIEVGMAIGSDTAQGKPHDVLEYTAAAGSAAFLLGKRHCVAHLLSYMSYSSDTPDFWRRDGVRYPSHAGRFTGEPAYFAHVMGAGQQLLAESRMKPSDFDYCVFHMPNGKFPRQVGKRLGFTNEQLSPSLTVDVMGNPYSASSMIGLSAVLDIAKPKQKIFMVSYGSGAGSDAFIWEATNNITEMKKKRKQKLLRVRDQIEKKVYIGYLEYVKKTKKI